MEKYLLKYGCNPHQKPAEILAPSKELPFSVLNGNPGYINFLDALNAWQLVRDLKAALNLPAAASFKHVSPAGAAVGLPLSDALKKAYHIGDIDLSPTAAAYARARGADRMSSFGDWAAISETVDLATAMILKSEVSDGIIAPDYTPEALEILKKKKNGNYSIISIDPSYQPEPLDKRQIFGLEFVQNSNDFIPSIEDLRNVVTENKELPESAQRDMILAILTLKYTQSNSVCFVAGGQVIGNGAGQQSRIHCTRLAGEKADLWRLKQHPKVLGITFREGVGKPDRDNALDLFVRNDTTEREMAMTLDLFAEPVKPLTQTEKEEWLLGMEDITIGS
ncbi:MAG: phosphoribosylaminoimidazolecarboxamide formyltransferase, partial [Peptococcaceae bacterium]|nr:phosphoribosylaminoimidazolecarboxamide formyltransferase [Peptococcaceae bacterium]